MAAYVYFRFNIRNIWFRILHFLAAVWTFPHDLPNSPSILPSQPPLLAVCGANNHQRANEPSADLTESMSFILLTNGSIQVRFDFSRQPAKPSTLTQMFRVTWFRRWYGILVRTFPAPKDSHAKWVCLLAPAG